MTTTASSPRDGTLTVTINACQLPLTGELLARSGGGAQYRGKLFEIMIYKLAAKDFRGLLMDQKVIMPKPISRAYTLQPGRPASFQPVDQARSDRAQTHHTGACRPRRYLARLVQRIEKGDPACAIGAFFEVAAIVGVRLFNADHATLSMAISTNNAMLVLLPKSVRPSSTQ